MKLILYILIIMTSLSCSQKKNKIEMANSETIIIGKVDTLKKTEIKINNIDTIKTDTIKKVKNKHKEIPPDGTYIYDIAYAEWQGRSMGEKVKIVIEGNTIKVISEGNPSVTAEKGDILDEGTLLKHNVTGDWLISNNPLDVDLEVYGSCVGEPMVIDFICKVYITC